MADNVCLRYSVIGGSAFVLVKYVLNIYIYYQYTYRSDTVVKLLSIILALMLLY